MGRAALTALALASALALQLGALTMAHAEVATQAELNGPGQVTVTTDENGEAWIKVDIPDTDPTKCLFSAATEGCNGDTVGYLYDQDMNQVMVSDDCNEDVNFCVYALDSDIYYLMVQGKESQPGASITVELREGGSMSLADCRYTFEPTDPDDPSTGVVSNFEVGYWDIDSMGTSWVPFDSSRYTVEGYVQRDIFVHAQETESDDKISWKPGLPQGAGRFVVKVNAANDDGELFGSAYFGLDNVDPTALSELDPNVTTTVCNAIAKVELGKYTIVPTNWTARWDAVGSAYYTAKGYCTREAFEHAGGDEIYVNWKSGMPREAGRYVIRLQATNADENPYTGSCYVWADVDTLGHAGSGEWVVDKYPTYTAKGQRHMKCALCEVGCEYESIPALKGTTDTAGSGATSADYKYTSSTTVTYQKCLSTRTTATVPSSVKIDGRTYKVTAIADKAFSGAKVTSVTVGSNVKTVGKYAFNGCTKLKKVTLGSRVTSLGAYAFKGCKVLASVTIPAKVSKIGASAFYGCSKLKTVTVKSKLLKKANVKGCLKGSKVSTVKVAVGSKSANKKYVASYKRVFTAANCGKKVTVR